MWAWLVSGRGLRGVSAGRSLLQTLLLGMRPLCSAQYEKIFNTTRIPGVHKGQPWSLGVVVVVPGSGAQALRAGCPRSDSHVLHARFPPVAWQCSRAKSKSEK